MSDARGCARCDDPGGTVTVANQVSMPISGCTRAIDWCIHHLVAALNANRMTTVASCCGHGSTPGRIDLEDGRVLIVCPDRDAAQVVWQSLQQKKQPLTSVADLQAVRIGPDGSSGALPKRRRPNALARSVRPDGSLLGRR